MTCSEIDLLIAAQAVGSLDARESAVLEAHLRGCERCQRAATAYAATVARLPLGLELKHPPPALRTLLLARLYAEAATLGGRPTVRERLGRVWRRVPASRGLTLVAAVTATAALGLLGAILNGRPAGPTGPVVTHFGGTARAPAVDGSVTRYPGIRDSILIADGLPRSPAAAGGGPGSGAYEVWLIHPDDSVVAAAYLTLAPDGHTWTAVISRDLDGYVAVTATIERSSGSRRPTGPEVIHAALSGG